MARENPSKNKGRQRSQCKKTGGGANITGQRGGWHVVHRSTRESISFFSTVDSRSHWHVLFCAARIVVVQRSTPLPPPSFVAVQKRLTLTLTQPPCRRPPLLLSKKKKKIHEGCDIHIAVVMSRPEDWQKFEKNKHPPVGKNQALYTTATITTTSAAKHGVLHLLVLHVSQHRSCRLPRPSLRLFPPGLAHLPTKSLVL